MSNFKHSFFRTLLYAQLLSGFSGVAIAAQISLSVKDRPMREVIKELEETTEYRFFYNDGIKGLNSPISVDVEDADINAVMDAIAKQANVAYVLKSGHQIVLSSVKTVQQQGNKKVTGTITDPKGEPIIGANVVVKGSTNGTITDIDGHFSIEVTPNAILQVSYIGYVVQDVPVGNKDNLVISIHEDTQKLDEVVVVGYGSQKKVNLTGAVEQVTSDVFEGRPTANATQMLEGVVPNLNISLSDGKPGRTADFNVRGAGSINGGSALVLIDGVEGDPSMLNPNDIESISVLKDAAASAIYGARAPFGVVLITTKNATEGKPKVTWSSSYSLQSPQNVPDVVSDGYIWAKHFYDAYFNYNQANPSGINKTQQFSVAWLDEYKRRHETGDFGTVISDGSIGTKGRYVYYPEGTDYYDLMYKKSVFAQNQNLSISGSDGKFDYYLSGRFYSYDGLFDSDEQTDKFKTYNMRFKGGYQLTPWLKINNNFEFSHNKYYNPITYSEGSGVVWRNIADEGHPSSPLFNPDGTMTYSAVYTVGDLLYGRSGITTKNSNLKNTTTFNAKFLGDRLRVNGDFTYQQKTQEKTKKQVRSPYARSVDADGESQIEHITGTYSNLAETTDHTNYLATNLFAEFEETFAEKHYFKAMAGWNYEKSTFKRIYAYNDDLLTDDVDNMNLVMGTDNRSITSQWKAYQFGGAFFRLNYAFDDRYLLEVNGRYDGSSRFAPGNRWRMFPGVSASWRISQEEFLKSSKVFNELKLRASYGQTGNQEGIRLYDYIQLLKFRDDGWGTKLTYPFGSGSQTQAMGLDVLAGVNRTWEILENINAGVDAAFLDSRLGFSFDYFVKMNNNMLIPVTYPSMLGATPPDTNSGKLRTNGFELTLNWTDKIGNVEYSAQFQLSDAKNKLVEYGGSDTYELGLNKTREGYPINSYFAYVYDGVVKDQADLDAYKKLEGVPSNIGIGDAKFKDLNGDGKISTYGDKEGDDGDAKYVGSTTPRYTFGLNLGAKWNNFDISVFFQGVAKRTLFREGEFSMPWSDWWRYPPQFYYGQTWNEDRQDAYYPRLTHGDIRHWNYQASTMQKINAAYVRLKNIQIGYTLPKSLLQKIGIERTRFYVSGQDLFEIHGVKGGWDPESDTGGFNYPFQRYYSFGIDLTF